MALLHTAVNDNGASGTNAFTLTIVSTTVGSLLVVPIWYKSQGGVTISSVTDSASQTWTQAVAPVSDGVNYSSAMYYRANTAAGVTSVIVTLSTGAPRIVWCCEESGIFLTSAVDSTPVGLGQQNVSSWTSGNMGATSNVNDVLYGFSGTPVSTNQSYAATGGWTAVAPHHANTGDVDDSFFMRQVVNATGGYAATGTCTSTTNIVSLVAAFKQLTVFGTSGDSSLGGGLDGGFQ